MSRITYEVVKWNGRHRAEVYVDGYKVRQGFFRFEDDAVEWCQQIMRELALEVRE